MENDRKSNGTTLNSNAAFELKMMELENAKSIAERNPLLRKAALIVLAFICFAIVTQFGGIIIEKSMSDFAWQCPG